VFITHDLCREAVDPFGAIATIGFQNVLIIVGVFWHARGIVALVLVCVLGTLDGGNVDKSDPTYASDIYASPTKRK
jgi:hypothetical protein